jgi:hypothetical protein
VIRDAAIGRQPASELERSGKVAYRVLVGLGETAIENAEHQRPVQQRGRHRPFAAEGFRSFAELADLGVRVDGAKVTIVDSEALTEFARPDPLIDAPNT